MKKTLALLAALSMPFFMTSCDDDDDDDNPVIVTETSITDLAVATPELSTLVAALERLELDDDFDMVDGTEYTVLAPTNTAFQELLDSNEDWTTLDDIPTETLEMVLNYHVIGAELMSDDIQEGSGWATTSAMGPGDNGISLYINRTGEVVMFDEATVSTANVDADNGVVHIIDKVLMPKNLLNRAMSLDNFSTLVTAVQFPGLTTDFVAALDGDGPLTVFAPDNDAFTALLESNEAWNGLGDIGAELLNSVLLYHVASGNFQSSQLTDGMPIPTLLDGQGLEYSAGMSTLRTTSGADVMITGTDIQTTNGVIHVVEDVLVPGS
jgi:transforming growth factor-beta-induced protein